jgi:hypothetical protein
MKQALAGALVAAVFFTAAGFAYSTQGRQGVTPAQFAALSKRVKKLEKANTALTTYVGGCLIGWKAVTSYDGYLYQGSSGQIETSALDYTESGDTPDGYMNFTTNKSCTSSSTQFRGVHLIQTFGSAVKR